MPNPSIFPSLPLPRAIRLYDIAREAGVAPSTVSRAFANPERVNFQTLEHIRAVADRLGYRPGAMRDSSPGPGRKMLDLLVQDISNPFYSGLAKGAERQARAAGYTVILGDAEESADMERIHIQRLLGTVDGFIIAARWLSGADLLELNRKCAVVLFNREVKGLSSVVTDADEGSRQIIEHLASLGHRRVVYLSGPRLAWADAKRWNGLSRAAGDAGIDISKAGHYLPTLGQGAAAADVALSHRATAVVAFNDQLAIGVLRRLQHKGIDVPGRISVVSYDDTFGSDFCHRPLTCLTAPVEQAGRTAVDLLMATIRGAAEPRQVVLPTPLHVRESTGPAR